MANFYFLKELAHAKSLTRSVTENIWSKLVLLYQKFRYHEKAIKHEERRRRKEQLQIEQEKERMKMVELYDEKQRRMREKQENDAMQRRFSSANNLFDENI